MLSVIFRLGPKFYRHCAIAILTVVGIVAVLTFRDYGVTWDEELQSQYGLAIVDYYASLFQDHRYHDIFNLYLYGGMFDGMASLIDRYTPFSLYETRHLVNAFVGMLGLWGTWRLGRLLGGTAVGLISLIMLVLTPMYYGHMFNNPKDIPFAAGIVWSLYYMGRCCFANAQVPRRLIIKLGIALGLTLGIRIGGVMLPAFWFFIQALVALRETNKPTAIHGLFRTVIPVGIIAYIVMLICWPWAQENPIMNPLRALSEFSNFPQDVEVLLDGVTYRSTQLPWYYVPIYFGIQLPEFLLVLLASSLITLPFIWSKMSKPRQELYTLTVAMGSFPIVYAMLRHPALYDCVRHFLFVLPLACILSAISARHIYLWSLSHFTRIESKRALTAGYILLASITIFLQLSVMIQLHPFEYIYANRFVGGVVGIKDKYELDYWASSFKEAAEELQKYVAKTGGVPQGKIFKVAICGSWASAIIYLPPDYEAVIANEPAEFFLTTTRWGCQNMRPGREIIEVSRMGAPLAIVKDLRNGYEYYPGNSHRTGPSATPQ